MKKFYGALLILLMLSKMVNAQAPVVQWQKQMEPTSYQAQAIHGMVKLKSGGFVLVGMDTLGSYDFESEIEKLYSNYGAAMIMRVDSAGNKIWGMNTRVLSLWNSSYEAVLESQQAIMAVGYNEVYQNNIFQTNFLITKFSLSGNVAWYKEFGGSGNDRATGIVPAHDSGYIVAGTTYSNNGDVSGNHGGTDIWVVKIGESGNLLWQKCYGTGADEEAFAVQATPDGGYLIAGGDTSTGSRSALVIKIDGAGNQQWYKTFGGTGYDRFHSLKTLADGGAIAVGRTSSNDGNVSGNHGNSDVWAVRLDALGNVVWSKCFGGTNRDYGMSVDITEDGGFLVTGFTESNNGDVSGLNGSADTWLIKVDANGNLVWQKTIGTPATEYGTSASAVSDNSYILTSNTYSSVGWPRIIGSLNKLGNGNTIKGRVFLDNNLSGTKDANEPYLGNQLVQTQKQGGYTRSAITNNGAFSIDVDTGTYNTSVLYNSTYYTVTPASFNKVFNTYFNTDSINFALQPIPGIKDLVVSLMGLTPVRPGFDARYKIFYKNQGTEAIASGTVQWVKSSKLNFVSASPAQSSQSGDTLRWNFTNLAPQDSASILINCTVAPPPTTVNGEVLRSVATILPVIGDLTPLDDTSRLSQTVTGSYDPNDKKEVHDGKLKPEQVAAGEWLQYTIRFQNTGTDTAFNIIVRDTLSSKVDLTTLQMVSASHSYALNIKDGNKLTWTFSNIKLVDSVRNEPLSHGYIVYRIKPLPTLLEGDIILNSASIYFDFNLPIQTNEEETQVLSEILPVHLLSFTAQKRGDKNILQWRSATEANSSHYEMERSNDGKDYKKIGKVPAAGAPANYSFTDENPFRDLNYYRLKMVDKDGTHAFSVIRVVHNAEGISRLSLYPNPVKDAVTLKVFSDKTKTLQVDIVNAEGKLIQSQKLGLNEGANTRTLNLANLPKGTYFARVTTANEQVAVKFEKL